MLISVSGVHPFQEIGQAGTTDQQFILEERKEADFKPAVEILGDALNGFDRDNTAALDAKEGVRIQLRFQGIISVYG